MAHCLVIDMGGFGRRRGAISGFLIIVIPGLILLGFMLYDLLYMRHRDEKALKIVSAVSEARLARYNEFLKSEYGIFANLDVAPLDEFVDGYMTENGFMSRTTAVNRTLDDPAEFRKAVLRSGKGMFVSAVLEELIQKTGLAELRDGIREKLDALDEKYKTLSDCVRLPQSVRKLKNLDELDLIGPGLDRIREDLQANRERIAKKSDEIRGDLQELDDMAAEFEGDLEGIREEFESQCEKVERFSDELMYLVGIAERSEQAVEDSESQIGELERENLRLAAELENHYDELSAALLQENEDRIELLRLEMEDLNMRREADRREVMEKLSEDLGDLNKGIFDDFIAMFEKGLDGIWDAFRAVSTDGGELRTEQDYTERSFSIAEGGVLEKMAVVEWCIRFFSRYEEDCSKENRAIKGELEYLVSGNKNEDGSLREVKLKISAMRFVPNFITFLKTPVRAELDLALLVVPPPFDLIAKGIVYSAFAMGESYLDVEGMLKGEVYRIMKKPDEWQLSFEGLLHSAIPEFEGDSAESGSDFGKLGYADYMRTLLYLQSEEKTILRAMNLIQGALSARTSDAYSLSDFSVGHVLDVYYENQSAFTRRRSHIHYENAYE